MLQEMRKFTKTKFANVLLGVLALTFVSWGANGFWSAQVDTSVAKVGGTAIEKDEYQRDLTNAMREEGLRRTGHPLTDEEARKLGVGNAILEQKISSVALDNVVRKLGLTAGDAQITASIQGIPAFAGLTGQFDRQMFLTAIQRFGYTEKGFIEQIRNETARSQLVQALESGFTLPPGYASLLFSFFFEQRAADYIAVDETALAPIPVPPDATLQAYIKAHADKFSTPEYRDITFAWISTADVLPTVKVTDEQIKQFYDEHKSEYIIAEKRNFQQLLFTKEAAAKTAYDKAVKGDKFEGLTNEKGEKPTEQTDFSAEDLDTAQAKVVFALAKDGIAPPLKTATGGWVLFKVTAITPAVNRTLDEMKEEIRGKVAEELAIAKLSDINNAYTDESSRTGNLLQSAKTVGMHSGRVAAIDAAGLTPDGKKADVPDDAEFRTMAFSAEPGEEGDPHLSKANVLYVVEVNGATPPRLRPLDQVREKALTAWMAEERVARLKKKVQDLTAQANREGSLDGAAKAVGAKVEKSKALQQGIQDDTFSPELLQNLFKAMPGKTVSGPNAKNGGYIIARVTGIKHPKVSEKDPQYQAIVKQIAQQVGGTINETFIAQQRADQEVTYNRKNIDSVQGSEAQ